MPFIRASAQPALQSTDRARPQAGFEQPDLQAIAQHMYALMLRNIATDGFVFSDPVAPGNFSRPGCVLAAPSYPANTPGIDQDYVFNWTRDAAITALELVAAAGPGASAQSLIDYVTFAQLCQGNATPTLAHAAFTIDGRSRPWSEQSDGPAVQTIAILAAWDQLDAAAQTVAAAVIERNIDYLLNAYTGSTTNLWEEHVGYSFFARSVQLRCFAELEANPHGLQVPSGVADAITWLTSALAGHWNDTYYVTLLAPPSPGVANAPAVDPDQGYDPNIDIVQAAIYGAIPRTDTKLLATAGQLRQLWSDSGSRWAYPINLADQRLGIGPMLGRYPGDTYDGDTSDRVRGGHPWALCTCNFAELYYRLANDIAGGRPVPLDDLSGQFFSQIAISAASSAPDAVAALRSAGDAMLRAVIYHSDHLELSEQFDGTSGFEKSVRDLTWSYAAFLSAVRARNGVSVRG